MKIRSGFVSNSSSSSFVCIRAGDKIIYSNNDYIDVYDLDEIESDKARLEIDDLMETLKEARERGLKYISVEYGEVCC